MNKAIHAKVKAALQDFVYGFNEKQLDIGILKGQIELKDLIIKPDKLNEQFKKANLPIRLKAGMIAHIKIKV